MMFNSLEALDEAGKRIQKKSAVQAAAGNPGIKEKAVSSTNAQYAHGPFGLFNQPGVDQTVYSTIIRPLGISALFPMRASVVTSPLYQIVTGQDASSGSEPTSECSTPLEPGKLYEGTLTAPFGRVLRKTPNLLANRIGQIVNRGEPMDTRVLNQNNGDSPWIPDNAKTASITQNELAKQFWQLGLEFERTIERMTFNGNPATQSGNYPDYGYKEFAGLQLLINTGKIDALTGAALPAADPIVVNWNSAPITGTATVGSAANQDIVTALTSIFYAVMSKAERMGLLPSEWVWAMTPNLFYSLTQIWPCSYLTNGCATSNANGTQTLFVNAAEQITMRDEMRGGSFLWVMGYKIPVFKTDAIPTTAAGGGVKADIYLIPRSMRGEFVTYFEYFDYQNGQWDDFLTQTLMGTQFQTSNGGLYLWTYDRDGYCFNFTGKVEPRLIGRTSFLAGRLTNVVYNTPISVPSGFPGDLYPAPNGGASQGSYTGPVYAGY
jgi:hypothetical protein